MNLNRLTKQVIIFIAGFVTFLCLLGVASHYDYQEAVMQNISCTAYNEIVGKVGNDADDVIEEYMAHRSYYDSLE